MALPLFAHQKASIDFQRKHRRVFDASDPGTGKTRSAVEAFAERRVRGGKKALVLAPKSILKAAWQQDFHKFAPYIRTSVAYAHNREAAFWDEADVYITNHDAAKWLAKQPDSFFDEFDTLIVDEIGAYKNSTSQRSKAINKIKKHFDYRLGMNGTPTPNTITELWHQMYIIDDGVRLGHSFFKFRASVCTPKQVGPSAQMIRWEDKPGADSAVTKTVEDITIRHEFEKCTDIPPNHEYAVEYNLTPKQRKAYEQMEAAQIAAIRMNVITAVNAAAVSTKLLQIASGAVYDENGDYHLIDKNRYETILDLAEQRKHVIVFFLWKHQKDQLIEAADKRKLSHCLIDSTVPDGQRAEYVKLFQQGMYRICFAHPQSAGHGLTLTKATATIWASPTYNLEHYQQGFRRVYRATQTQKTETIVVMSPETIELKVWDALKNKKVRMDSLLTQLAEEREHGRTKT